MAETAAETVVEQQQQQAPPASQVGTEDTSYTAPAVETLPGTSADEIRNALNSVGSFVSEKTRKEMEAQLAAAEGAQKEPPAKTEGAEKPAETPAAEKKEEKPAEKKEEKAEDGKFKSKFGLKTPSQEKKADVAPIETPDQMLGAIKSTFGMELKETKELPKFFEVATNWRKDAEKLKTVESDHKKITEAIQSLPEEFHSAFQMISAGEDWTQAFTAKQKIDFSIPAEKQDIKTLIEKYYPKEFTEDDFKEETPSKALEIAISASRDKFNTEKAAHDSKRASTAEAAKKRLELFNASVAGSVNYLKQNFPDTEEPVVKSVQSVLSGGPQSVVSFFFKEDGSLKPEAAESLMMAMYGKEEIQGMMEIAQHSKETQLNEDLLTRGADRPAPVQRPSGGGNALQISEEEKKTIESMKELGKLSRSRTF